MRRSPQDRYLPPIVVQIFGVVIVIAITVAGLLGQGNPTILLAVLGVAAGFVLLGGFYEKIKADVTRAIAPPDPPAGGGKDGRPEA